MPGLEGAKKEVISLMRMMAQNFLTDEEYFNNLDSAIGWVKDQMKEDGQVQMAFLIHGRKREPKPDDEELSNLTIAVMADWPDDIADRKQEVMMGLAAEWVDKNPDHMMVQVIQVGEAWVSKSKNKEDILNVRPSDDPNRIECVTVHTSSIDQRASQILYEIVRGDDGAFKELKNIMDVRYDPNNDSSETVVSYLVTDIWRGYFLATDKEDIKKEQ